MAVYQAHIYELSDPDYPSVVMESREFDRVYRFAIYEAKDGMQKSPMGVMFFRDGEPIYSAVFVFSEGWQLKRLADGKELRIMR